MVIVAIVALAGVVLVVLFGALSSMPSLDLSGITTVINYMLPYLQAGRSFLYTFVYPQVVNSLIVITASVEAVILTYKIAMWVAKKIPMFGVSD